MLVVGSGSGHVGGSLTDLALQVAAAAKCPVAVIGTQDLDGRHGVVVGVDGSEESIQSVAFAAAEADRDGQELTVFHAFSGPNRLGDAGLTPDDLAELIVEEERIVLAETVAGLRGTIPTSSSIKCWKPIRTRSRRCWKPPQRQKCWWWAAAAVEAFGGSCSALPHMGS
jgi:hypothetical protein